LQAAESRSDYDYMFHLFIGFAPVVEWCVCR
jgi:hypothetical protein